MSAGSSDAGRQFAATHADLCFVTGRTLEDLRDAGTDIRSRAEQLGRTVQIWAAGIMITGETEADAKRQFDYVLTEHGDAKTSEDSLRLQIKGKGQSVKWEITPELIRERMVGSLGKPFDRQSGADRRGHPTTC